MAGCLGLCFFVRRRMAVNDKRQRFAMGTIRGGQRKLRSIDECDSNRNTEQDRPKSQVG
jgi:hypothetical protein